MARTGRVLQIEIRQTDETRRLGDGPSYEYDSFSYLLNHSFNVHAISAHLVSHVTKYVSFQLALLYIIVLGA